ncbi:MAG: ligase-associated DNA damage response endonuclease PdeM [Bacteroidota bacterium]|nr:ligase-associated DNA damage response endonuclease PdeM [Bacteroidota bacterium]
MPPPIQHIIQNQHLWLSAQRCIYWEENKTLILSDPHFGKTGHFRKQGIAVPQPVYQEDLQRMVTEIALYSPEQVIVVGDLFHSIVNKEMDLFVKWRRDFRQLDFLLVKGNHDILTGDWYAAADIQVKEGIYTTHGFDFVHDPAEAGSGAGNYVFSGHLHPGVRLQGLGKQSLQFPCYYFSDKQAILPAFSKFSGLSMVRKKKADKIFAIVNQSLVPVQ